MKRALKYTLEKMSKDYEESIFAGNTEFSIRKNKRFLASNIMQAIREEKLGLLDRIEALNGSIRNSSLPAAKKKGLIA